MTYKIKRLEWISRPTCGGWRSFHARGVFGRYAVRFDGNSFSAYLGGNCIADRKGADVESMKAACRRDYVRRLKHWLKDAK